MRSGAWRSFSRWSPRSRTAASTRLPRRLGQQYLISVSGGRDACSSVHVETHIPLVRKDRLAGMDPDANPDRARRERVLSDPRRLDGVARSSEGEEERVTLRVDFDASVRRRRLTKDPAMLGEHFDVVIPQFVKQAGRALDVREDERDRSRREIDLTAPDDA